MFNPAQSDVQIRTNPDKAQCRLSGRGGYNAEIETPAKVTIPHSAAPVTVTCEAPGFRRTVASLQANSSGWIWANSGFIVATGGAAVLGLVVDEALGSDWTYRKDVNLELDAERVRPVRVRSRDGSEDLRLEAR
ncbi:hypothetical protein A6A04_07550 [Paramagnetospirillum marisnigri]|uniref:Uncharacterized protein n=1 Tax=Paramagnetospirillum marisnigri TaxID=1285242 RepID=A0A178M830_9PROT|nr:hypothetical protein [Paramagnetospirillum marisnigri]OAN44676.1 hypothetical protein A6A04_07550 [Paramagnetospirillum marisnigri]